MAKKNSFWRDFGIGVVASVAGSVIVIAFLESRIQNLQAQIAAAKR